VRTVDMRNGFFIIGFYFATVTGMFPLWFCGKLMLEMRPENTIIYWIGIPSCFPYICWVLYRK